MVPSFPPGQKRKKKHARFVFILVEAAGVHSARDLFEGGHAAGDEIVGHQSRDAHHGRAPVVELLRLL